MREPNKNKMAGVNSRFASVSQSEILKIQEDAVPENTKKATKFNTSTDIQIVQENIQFSTHSCEHWYNFWWIRRQLLFQLSFQVNFKNFD